MVLANNENGIEGLSELMSTLLEEVERKNIKIQELLVSLLLLLAKRQKKVFSS